MRGKAHFTEFEVRSLRRAFMRGWTSLALSKVMGVPHSTMQSVVQFHSYKKVSLDGPAAYIPEIDDNPPPPWMTGRVKSYGVGKPPKRALTMRQARSIREAAKEGEVQGSIARRYGVARGTISKIVSGATYRETGRRRNCRAKGFNQ